MAVVKPLVSCLYEGYVQHRRFEPRANRFRYRTHMFFLDLSEIEQLLPESWLWSTRRPAICRYRRSDFFGDPLVPLDSAVRDAVAAEGAPRPGGPIRMLTQVRQFGYLFNPVTFYYCYDDTGTAVSHIVVDITNTPWHERHAYILHGQRNLGRLGWHRHRLRKTFHVSPFMAMDHDYDWRFSEPAEHLVVHFQNGVEGRCYFDASLTLTRRELSQASLLRSLAKHPLMTIKVTSAIYWQALRLFAKRVPFHPHPRRRPRTTSANP